MLLASKISSATQSLMQTMQNNYTLALIAFSLHNKFLSMFLDQFTR